MVIIEGRFRVANVGYNCIGIRVYQSIVNSGVPGVVMLFPGEKLFMWVSEPPRINKFMVVTNLPYFGVRMFFVVWVLVWVSVKGG